MRLLTSMIRSSNGPEQEAAEAITELANRHDAFQPRYLVSHSLGKTVAAVLDLAPQRQLAL